MVRLSDTSDLIPVFVSRDAVTCNVAGDDGVSSFGVALGFVVDGVDVFEGEDLCH